MLDFLGQAGSDPVDGGRQRNRAIHTHMEKPVERDVIDGEFANGDTIKVKVKGGGLEFVRA